MALDLYLCYVKNIVSNSYFYIYAMLIKNEKMLANTCLLGIYSLSPSHEHTVQMLEYIIAIK